MPVVSNLTKPVISPDTGLLTKLLEVEENSKSQNHYDLHYFQVLIVNQHDDGSIETTLLTKQKQDFKDIKVLEAGGTIGSIADSLPSNGVQLDPKFLPIKNLDGSLNHKNLAKYSTARFLFQCRKLSQLMAKTWLSKDCFDNDLDAKKAELARKIFFAANLRPNNFEPSLAEIPTTGETTDCLIKSDRLNQQGLQLSLLFGGLAYTPVEPGSDTYVRLCEPILSNYELVYEYAFKVSWDTFYANRTDYPQSGNNPVPPYYEVVMPYPPRPELSEFTVKPDQVKAWANADEHDGKFPFYPENIESSDGVQFVHPPYPYLLLSCC